MERFALAAAVVLGFALTAALCSLFVPLQRVLERREQQQQPVQPEQPRPAPLRAPLWVGCVLRRARWLRWAWAGLPPA